MIFSLLHRLFGFEWLLAKRERLRRRYLPSVDMLEDRRLLSLAPQLLRDIGEAQRQGSSLSRSFTEVNGIIFFVANDGMHGTELWKSDGTCVGTTLVTDVNPGSSGASPDFLTNVNGTLFFSANDGTSGIELWLSNGSSAGTTLVKDINLGSSGAYSASLTNANGTLFFSAYDTVSGIELWKSDGTSAGTILVRDINPSSVLSYDVDGYPDGTMPGSSVPFALTNVSGTLFFSANDGTNGRELWRSDGTCAGTTLVEDINPGTWDSGPVALTNMGGALFFSANDGTSGIELWKSDGTCAGTILVRNINPHNYYYLGYLYLGNSSPAFLTNVNGMLFFSADDGTSGAELWKSDGTCAGTTLVSARSAYPSDLTNVGGTLFFSANDGTRGSELWKSDGTCAGTILVRDINPHNQFDYYLYFQGDSNPDSLTNVNGTLFFSADDGSRGTELWMSDGTCAGTTRVKDINPGGNSAAPFALRNVSGTLFFSANDGTHGDELWRSDGTCAGTTLVKDINSAIYISEFGSDPQGFTSVGGTLFFSANDGTHGDELWRSDGTCAGTTLVKDIDSGGSSADPASLTNVNGTLFFSANEGLNGTELWRSDGSCAGTILVRDITPGTFYNDGYYYPASTKSDSLTNVNGTLFFSADEGLNGTELWRSDGSCAGTILVRDIRPGGVPYYNQYDVYSGTMPGSSYPFALTNVNGTLFFSADDGVSGNELWKSDGSCAGTILVRDINPSSVPFYDIHGYPDGTTAGSSDPRGLANVNGTLFFRAYDVNGNELWHSDGSSAGTTLVKDINPGSSSAYPGGLTNVNGTLFFQANDGMHGDELWQSDGGCAGTTLVKDIYPGTYFADPGGLTNINGTLFFSAHDGTKGSELWQSNGTCTGTTVVRDINPGSSSAYPGGLSNVNGMLFFQANDGTHGNELWQSDGSSAGTTLVKDINPGTSGAYILSVTNVNGTLFFGADDGVHGSQPWVLAPNHPPTANNDAFGTDEDVTLVISAALGVLANDTDADGDPIPAFLAVGPLHGALMLNGNGSFTYTPSANYNGTDSFAYKANDGELDSNTATVTLVVNAVNDPPVANNDSYSVNEDTTLTIAAAGVLANDTDVDPGTGQPETLTALLVTGAVHGTVVLNGNGKFTYIGSANFNGTDSFTYKVDDGGTGAHLSSTATVTLLVTAVNDAPVANNDSYSVNEDTTLSVAVAGVLSNDTDLDPGTGNPETLTAVLVSGASHGTATLQANGAFTYLGSANFNGTDSFTYKVDDGGTGAHVSNTATVTIVVNAVNDAPLANNDSYSVNEDVPLSVGTPGVLGNDTDVDPGTGQPETLTAIVVTSASHGTLTVQGNGAFTYLGSQDFNGTDSFTYQVDDGGTGAHLSNAATVTIVINAVNDAPVTNNDAYSVDENATLNVTAPGVMANDSDVDPGTGQPETLTTILINGASFGTLTLNDDGSFIYVGGPDFNGIDSFTYQVDDNTVSSNLSGTATVVITVNAVNSPPVANNDSFSINEDLSLSVAAAGVLGNDTDPDTDTGQPETLTAIMVAGASHGTAVLQGDGSFTYIGSQNFNGTDSFTYKVDDAGTGAHLSNTATVTIVINPVNDPPIANNDSYSVNEDATLSVAVKGVLGNDTDVDPGTGQPQTLTALLVAGAGHGTIVLQGNGAFTYIASANFNGTDSFTYKANDGLINGNTATVTIVVNAVNDPPVANNDSYSINEDTTLSVAVAGVLGNDTDVDPGTGQPQTLTAILVAGAGHGTVVLQGNGAFTYIGSANYNGTDSFTYKANDGAANGNTATVTILVNAVNDAPVASNDSYSVNENATLTIAAAGVLANDTDVDPGTGQPETLTALLVGTTTHGTLTLQGNGAFTYAASTTFVGTDSFTYKTNDGSLESTVATATIIVAVPVANNDSYSFFEDQTLSVPAVGVLANDTDADGDALTAQVVSGPVHGTLTLQSNGAFTYTPSADYNGSDSFTYLANDGPLNSNVATAILTIIPVNDAPVACNDLYSVFEDQSLGVGAPGVLGNDFDIDSPTITALLVNPPLHGTLTLNANGSLAYVPAANYNGTDSFTYKANDGSLNSNLATVSIVVVSVNDPPVSGDDSYSVFEDATLSVAAPGVLNNDSDIDSPTLTPLLAGGPGHGTLTFNADGSFTYAPNANYNGTDSFTYRSNDGALGSNLATVTIVVDPVNDAPLAGDDARSVFENGTLSVAAAGVLLNDSDIDSPTLTALLVTGPTHGTLTLNSDGSLIYVPNVNYSGTDSFTYKANDGLLNSNLATVSINVDPVNQAPTANNDAYSLFEDFTLTRSAPGVLANDTDVDSPVLATNLVAGPAHGTLSFNTNGAFSYVPGLHYFGTDSFTYKANDGLLNSDVATVKITVIAVNHAPVANSNSYSVFEDSSLSVGIPGVLNNDSDIDGNSLTSILLAGAAHGTLTLRSNGAFTYTPATHYSGGDSFTYRANDGSLNSTAATVTLNVLFVNHAPTANADAYTVQGDTTLTVAVASGVLANDTDVENSALTALLAAGPAHGTLTLNVNGSFTYTPSSGFVGTDSFRYRANDGSANSTQATVTLTVQAPGPAAPTGLDVSDLVRAVSSALTDNHDGTFSGTITITNFTSDTDIDGPLQVVLTDLTPGITLQNKTGYTPDGDPYITIPAGSLTAGKLAPGQSTVVTVLFDDPLALSIGYITKTLSGTI